MATAAKKPAAKTAAKPATKVANKAAPIKSVTKSAPKKPPARAANTAFMKEVQIGAPLAAVIGATPVPRTEVTKKVWEYIKKHNLQNPANKRNILADDKLKIVFGGKKEVTMFEMTKLISAHLS